MKTFRFTFAVLLLLNMTVIVSCQDNTRNSEQSFINLIPSDSTPFAQLPDSIKQHILAYQRNPSTLDVRIITNPFPVASKLFEIRQLRCNMASNRTFYAERTNIQYQGNSIYWKGKLVGTGINTGNASDNVIRLYATALPNGTFSFESGNIEVSLQEKYSIQPLFNYWVFMKYDPTKYSLPADTVRKP